MNKQNLSFDNTEIAFASKSNWDLLQSFFLFKVLSNNLLTKIAPKITNLALFLRIPIIPIIKSTIYKQFCGGVSIADCEQTINKLAESNIGTILDYSIEGENNEKAFELTKNEIKATILKASLSTKIPFSVFKLTGIASLELLQKVQEKIDLNKNEIEEFTRVKSRTKEICELAYTKDVKIFIDAEESWIQDTIDLICNDMMEMFNKEKAIVYNTFQFYRWDRFSYLKNCLKDAKVKGYILGAKLVRGAYMEKEGARAMSLNYANPIHKSKEETDQDYDKALEFSIINVDKMAICAGTHNEESCKYLVDLMKSNGIAMNHPHIYFSQLLGMSDNLSYNLSHAGYNVAKYVPYGPVRSVLPYLFRRANENTSIAGQMSRELGLIVKERKRRKNN